MEYLLVKNQLIIVYAILSLMTTKFKVRKPFSPGKKLNWDVDIQLKNQDLYPQDQFFEIC